MKKFLWMVLIVALLGCQPASTPPVTASRYRVSDTPTALAISPTVAPHPKLTITLPPIAIHLNLPPVPGKIPAHKLALDAFNVSTAMKRINIYGTGRLNDFVFSPDGKYLAAATDRGIFFYNSQTFEQTSFIDVNDRVAAIAFSPDALVLAVAIDGKVSLWNIHSGQKLSTLEGEFINIKTLAYGKSGYIAAAGFDCLKCGDEYVTKMAIWDVKTGKQIYSEKEIRYPPNALAFTQDGKYLAYAGKDGLILLDVEKRKGNIILGKGQAGFVPDVVDAFGFSFIFNKDERSLFVTGTGSQSLKAEVERNESSTFDFCSANLVSNQMLGGCVDDGKIVLFDLATGEKHFEKTIDDFQNSHSWDRKMVLGPGGKTVVYGFNDVLHILNVKTAEEIKALPFNNFYNVQIGMMQFNGQLTYVAAILDQQGQVDLVNLENGAHIQTYSLPDVAILDFAFRPDQKTVATIDADKMFTLWNIQTQQILYQTKLSEKVEVLPHFMFSPDGLDLFFTTLFDSNILKLSLLSGEISNQGHSNNSYLVSVPDLYDYYHFNSVGHFVLFDMADHNYLGLKDIVTGHTQVIPFEMGDTMMQLGYAFNANDTLIALGNGNTIFVWNTETQQRVSQFTLDEVWGLSFNPQNNLLVSVGRINPLTILWDIHTGQELLRLGVCCQAQFTPDGRYLVTAGDGVLQVWGIPTPVP